MTEREIALYETMKILLNHLISNGVLDYSAARHTFQGRERLFAERGMPNASAMMATIRASIEPKRHDSRSPHPLSLLPDPLAVIPEAP